MESQGIHGSAVAFLLQYAVARAHIPQPPGAVKRGRAKVVALRVKPDSAQPLGMACAPGQVKLAIDVRLKSRSKMQCFWGSLYHSEDLKPV